MTKEIGPREKALREQRERQFAENQRTSKGKPKIAELSARVAVAAQKIGKPRKKK